MIAALFLRPWRPGDQKAFKPRADFAQDMAANGHDWEAGPPPGAVWTIARPDGTVEGVCGAAFIEPGVVQVWACVSDLPPRQMARVVGLGRNVLDSLAGDPTIDRIIADARLENPAAIGCLERLGFITEAEGRRVVNGVAYLQMERVI